MLSHFRTFVVAIVVLAGVAWSSAPAQARPLPRHAYRPAYGNPYYYGYAYAPYLDFNGLPYSGSWTNAGSSNIPLSYGYSGFPGGQSEFSFGAPDFSFGY